MKFFRKAAALLFALLCMSSLPVHAASLPVTPWYSGQETASAAVVLMEPDSGAILYAKGATDPHYPASITKLMTAVLAMEHCDPQEIVTFSQDAVYKCEGETSNIARDIGEEMTMEHCLYGMLLASANECAYAIAEHITDGDIGAFADMMNEKAAELGCVNTHFTNPNGLHDENHWTCAYDMALIARAAWQFDLLRTIMGTRYYLIPPTNKHAEETPLNNTHYMINYYKTNQYLYDDCLGGKTGYTPEARSTLVTYAERDGKTLIAVTMDVAAPDQYRDTIALFDAYLDGIRTQTLSPQDPLVLTALQDAEAAGTLAAESTDTVVLAEPLALALPADAEASSCEYTVTPADAADMTAALGIRTTGDEAHLPYSEENAVGLLEAHWQGVTVGYAPLWYTGSGQYRDPERTGVVDDSEETAAGEDGAADGTENPGGSFFSGLQLPKLTLPFFSEPGGWKLPALTMRNIILLLAGILAVALVVFFISFAVYVRKQRQKRRRYRNRRTRTIEHRGKRRRK